MDENNVNVESDLYDDIVEGVALVAGILAGVTVRYATAAIAPKNDTIIKMVFRESGSIALATATMGFATESVRQAGACLKQYIRIVKKN